MPNIVCLKVSIFSGRTTGEISTPDIAESSLTLLELLLVSETRRVSELLLLLVVMMLRRRRRLLSLLLSVRWLLLPVSHARVAPLSQKDPEEDLEVGEVRTSSRPRYQPESSSPALCWERRRVWAGDTEPGSGAASRAT